MTSRLPLWIDLRDVPVKKRLPYLKAVADAESEGVVLAHGDPHVGRQGLRTIVLGADGRLRKGRKHVGRLIEVVDGASQRRAANAKGIVVVDGKEWRVIPLENLVAARRDRPGSLYALARSPEQAALFADTLETGVHGIVLTPASTAAIRDTDAVLRKRPTQSSSATPTSSRATAKTTGPLLVQATIIAIEDAGLGDRVCIDTTSRLKPGEGLLVGSTARGFVLVHAETVESDFVRARPFRVNAGALHMYVLAPEGKTRYLSELGAGDEVLVVHHGGGQRTVTVGRAKIERRPHSLVRWADRAGGTGMAMLQTAETIRLVRPDGSLIAVTDLKPKDEVLVHAEDAARHFGMPVDANLEER